MDDERNECYPALPRVGWARRRADRKARRAAANARNALIGEVGAQVAAAAARDTGGSIGGQRKGKGS